MPVPVCAGWSGLNTRARQLQREDRQKLERELRLYRLALEEAERQATVEMQEHCRPLLQRFDADGNGYLSRDEFLEVVKQMGAGAANGCKRIGHGSLSPAAADRIVGYAMGEAQAPMALPALPKALLLAHAFVAEEVAMTDSLFDKYDTDKSGFLDINQIVPLLQDALDAADKTQPKHLTAAAVMYILSRADVDYDHKVHKEELAPALAIWKLLQPSVKAIEAIEDARYKTILGTPSRALLAETGGAVDLEAIVDDVRAMIEEEEQQWADLPVARPVSEQAACRIASRTLPIGQAVEANAADEEAVPMAQVVEPTEPTSQGLPMGEAVKPMAASPAAAALTDPFGSLGSLALAGSEGARKHAVHPLEGAKVVKAGALSSVLMIQSGPVTSTVKVANGELRMAHRTAALRLAEQQRANLKKLDSAVAAAGVQPPRRNQSATCMIL